MDGGPGQRHRNFLILQGVASRFFARLGTALEARGHGVKRINFHAGDWFFGPLAGAHHYRGRAASWPDYLEARLREWNITDIILFGDCRPIHAAAIAVARKRDIPFFVFEEGYLRPNWITLEQGGTNGYSTLPKDPAWYHQAARDLPPWQDGAKTRMSLWSLGVQDVAYNVSGMVFGALYPFYRWHRPVYPAFEYMGWIARLARIKLLDGARLSAGLSAVARASTYYLFPLQLEGDTQIREHFAAKKVMPAIKSVIESFARSAPKDALLVVKEHPLDNGLRNWRKRVFKHARRQGIEERLVYLPGGDLDTLVKGARGVVTINSTVGVRALVLNRPLTTLGKAIYNIPGLTFQGPLDRFWTESVPPDAKLYDAFSRVLLSRCLVNGNFYSKAGIEMAVAGSVTRLEAHPQRFAEPKLAVLSTAEPELHPGLMTDRFAIGR